MIDVSNGDKPFTKEELGHIRENLKYINRTREYLETPGNEAMVQLDNLLGRFLKTVDELQAKLDDVQWWEGIYDDKPLTKQQIIDELHDYHFMLKQVPKVYSEVTGGLLSKPNYYADDVIAAFRDSVEREIADALDDHLKDWEDDNNVDKEVGHC